MIQAFDHVAITVKNLQETIDFYAKLGFKPTTRNETSVQITQFLEAGQARIEVFAPKTTTTPPGLGQSDVGMKHIAFKVGNAQKVYEKAKANGITFSETRHGPKGNLIAFFKDPNGILLQILQR